MDNWGGNVNMIYKAARRLLICPTQDNSAVTNKINKSELVNGMLPISVLWAQMNKWWHIDANNKYAATPQLSEFTVEDVEPTASESEWYKTYMDSGARDITMFINDNAPYVTKQMKLALSSGGPYSHYIVTGDDVLLCKYDGTYFIPLEIQDGSIEITSYKLRGHTEHSKNAIKFRLNEVDSMNDLVGVRISDGSVTSDYDYFSLIDAVATATEPTANGVKLKIVRKYGDPLAPAVEIPITGIVFSNVAADAIDGEDNEAPAASENWIEDTDNLGNYEWDETGVFTVGKEYVLKISHPRVDVEYMTFEIPTP